MSKIDSFHDTGLLNSVSYFLHLDAAVQNVVSQSAVRHKYAAGQVVLIEGESCAGLYLLESGWLKVTKIGLDGREQVLQMVRAGEAFNAVSVFTDAPNQANVAALEESVVWIIQREVLQKLMEEQPAFARQVIKDLADRVMHLIRLVEDLSLRSVEGRLARLLLEHAGLGASVPRRRWATQAEMASRLGTVPDVVNRALRKLSDEGLIHVERHQIQILDKEGLKQIAQIAE
jgi:CRP/FNR family transcriptional regulator